MKGSVEISNLNSSTLREYLELCGCTLVRAHAQEQWWENHYEHCGPDWPHPDGKPCHGVGG